MAKLFHLSSPTSSYSEEGILRAKGKEFLGDHKNAIVEISGWFKNPTEKKQTIIDHADNLVSWLEKHNNKYPNLNLQVGTIKTWMKTSETHRWRYYFMMNEKTYKEIIKNIENEENSKLEGNFDYDFSDREDVTDMLDDIKKIKDLISFTKTYKQRCIKVFDTIKVRQKKIKGAPFQVMLLGMGDLESTVKKIVNIAI